MSEEECEVRFGAGGWECLVRAGCEGWLGCGRVAGCCWVPAGDAGMVGEEDSRLGDTTPTSRLIRGWLGRWLPGRGRLETGPYVRSGRRDSGGMKARSLGGPRDDKRRRAGGRRGLYGLGGGSGGGGFGLGLGAVPLRVAVSSRA